MTRHVVHLSRRQAEIVIIANTDDRAINASDAMYDADCIGLCRDDEDDLAGIYERAGLSAETGTDHAMGNACMLAAGFSMLAESDDNYNEGY